MCTGTKISMAGLSGALWWRYAPPLLIAACLLAGCAKTPSIPPGGTLESLIAAEQAFSAASLNDGTRAAFLDFLADRSVVFDPIPMDGNTRMAGRAPSDERTTWWPRHGELSANGDFGYTTGSWAARHTRGRYVTIWRFQAGGAWRAEVVARIRYDRDTLARPSAVASPLKQGWVRARRKLYQEAARVSMLKADRDLAQLSLAASNEHAMRGVLDDSVRFYRDGAPPGRGRDSMTILLRQMPGMTAWAPISGHIARGGDLGYTYGLQTVRASPADTTARSNAYLRIWKAQPDSTWRLVVDLVATTPIR